MSNELDLQFTRQHKNSSLSRPKTHSGLITRGLRDAAGLATPISPAKGIMNKWEVGLWDFKGQQKRLEGAFQEIKAGLAQEGNLERSGYETQQWFESSTYMNELINLTREVASQGNAIVQLALGVLYMLGLSIPPDYTEAVIWFLKAAGQGNAVAQYLLGDQYANGLGVPQDYCEAARLFRLAASQGEVPAQARLGHVYSSGQGVARDYVLAYMWLSLAGEEGSPGAREAVAAKMTPQQIAEAQRLAREWKPTPATGSTGERTTTIT